MTFPLTKQGFNDFWLYHEQIMIHRSPWSNLTHLSIQIRKYYENKTT